MKKKDKEIDETKEEISQNKLSKYLINELNKNESEKIAWCLATDSDNPTDVKDYISTGSTLLDYIISNKRNGGIPVGKLTEIIGEEASGKSLICAHILANTQKKGGIAVYIDTENAANIDFMRRVGVNINRLVYLQPGSIEEVFESIEKTIKIARIKNVTKPVTIIWDSIAGTPPQAEIEGDYDPNSRIGLAAKALAKGTRKLTQTVGKERITLIFTNQLKIKIGVFFGDPMTTPGGKAVGYHSSVRIRLTKSKEIKDDSKNTYAMRTLAKVIKTRLGPPLRKTEFEITFNNGIDDIDSWFTCLHEKGLIKKKGGWCYLDCTDIKFRRDEWKKIIKFDKTKEHVLNLIENCMIKQFDKEVDDQEIDVNSLLDNEAIIESIK